VPRTIHIIFSNHYVVFSTSTNSYVFLVSFGLCHSSPLFFSNYAFAFKACLSPLTKVCTPLYSELLGGGYCRRLSGSVRRIFFFHISLLPHCATLLFLFLLPSTSPHLLAPVVVFASSFSCHVPPDSVQLLLASLLPFCSLMIIFCCHIPPTLVKLYFPTSCQYTEACFV